MTVQIDIQKALAVLRRQDVLTAGTVGAKALFTFDRAWDGLSKVAVFRQAEVSKDVILTASEAVIPWETLTQPGLPLDIGVMGTDGEGKTVIPTVWVRTAPVLPGADPSGDESTDPTAPVWGQILSTLGDTDALPGTVAESILSATDRLLVDVFENEGRYCADLTFEEITAALSAGKRLYCRVEDALLLPHVFGVPGDPLVFSCVNDAVSHVVRLNTDGSVHYSVTRLVNDPAKEVFDFARTAAPNALTWELGYLGSTGVESDRTDWYRSPFVPVDREFDYTLLVKNGTASSTTVYYYLFDGSKAIIPGTTTGTTLSAGEMRTIFPNVRTPNGTAKYIRVMITAKLHNSEQSFVRLSNDRQMLLATRQEMKDEVCRHPKNVAAWQDYFGRDKKVVFIGDSITQGFGSTGMISFETTDGMAVKGNAPEYGLIHELPRYEVGKKLYQSGDRIWYEAIDGNGFAHHLQNYLQNRFGCTVKNYGMSGTTSAVALNMKMTAETSGLVTEAEGEIPVYQGLTRDFDTVFVMYGTNDRAFATPDVFVNILNGLVSALLAEGKKVILMSSIPAVENLNLTMEQINGAVQSVAEANNVPFISLYQGMLDYCQRTGTDIAALRKADGTHPNDAGYEVMASLIADGLGLSLVDRHYLRENYYTKAEIDALLAGKGG